ncbi:His Kinase A (phospho-acceptor) domain-containing protein [Acidiphilium rubrum]|uniref:histidine kinase n=2 Tax=Acidocellaceae TaxID=3385905 RepID=A0A8G2FL45_ACIRU|nr:His Kinase A (phospho-acceptor) domain-containing protein [Acidiphilium rubrum]
MSAMDESGAPSAVFERRDEDRFAVLAPIGRDAAAIAGVLDRAGYASVICGDAAALVAALDAGVAAAFIAEEGLFGAGEAVLAAWVDAQAPWSDLPFIVLTSRQVRPEVERWRLRMIATLRNAALIERPLDGLTLSSAAGSALRARRRQYEVRHHLAARAQTAIMLEHLVEDRTRELAHANTALHQQIAERERTEEALRQAQKMEAVGQLTGGLAHDFNNMLAGITGSLEIMRRRIAQGRHGELARYVDIATVSATRAAALTHRLLAFSRRQTLSPKPTDATALVRGMAALIGGTVGPAIRVETTHAPDVWPILCDPHQLESAVLNLVINARDAMPEGGRLSIELGNTVLDDAYVADHADLEAGDYVVLSISDSGTGMSPEVASRAFDPFFTTKPLGAGTGLGLSMVYGFTKQSSGHLRIYSELGSGTTIRMYLPRHHGGVGSADAAGLSAEIPRAQPGETVLIVDDESAIRMLVREVLDDLGYASLEAEDGRAALRILRSGNPINLLITDVGLPNGMNGRQLADAARQNQHDLRVLFITGYAEKAAVGNGLLDHGMEVMTKPFALHALASKIREMIH